MSSAKWGYEGSRAIVSGGGGAGMGAAVVRHLAQMGAEVHVLDLKEPPVDVASYHAVDLRDPEATAQVIDKIGGNIDSLFNCAGLAGSKFPDVDVMLVNLVGMRHVADLGVRPYEARLGHRQHLVDGRRWVPREHRQVDAAGDHSRLRGGQGVVRNTPRGHRWRVWTVERGHHCLDLVGLICPGRKRHTRELHQPRSD